MTGILPPSDKIRWMYEHSLYQVGAIRITINHYPRNMPARFHGKSLVMFGACNPGGRIRPEGWNRHMMERLRIYLSRYEYIEGKGSLRHVSEPLLLVVMNIRKAKVLARKFRQNAIVAVQDQHKSRLVYLA